MDSTFQAAQRQRYRAKFEHELFERVIPFWERHSPDTAHGGYYNNLDRDGSVYDTTKHIWLLARQVWMFSKLYRSVEERPSWLEHARLGMDFLAEHAARPDGRAYFALAADGRPIYQQRKIFTECFYAMALAEYGRAAHKPALVRKAEEELALVWQWAYDWTALGRPALAGAAPSQSLAVPMILLNVIEEVAGERVDRYEPEIEDCMRRVALHVNAATKNVHEHVSPDGSPLAGPAGRLLNPGHAIEAGWFLQHWAQRLGRKDLAQLALNMVRWSHHTGWDRSHGGLYYFLDAEGRSPVQLEWSMKLWWPHTEALYAHLLGFALSGNPADLEAFEAVQAYVFEHFVDAECGEWYGYLDRQGRLTHRFKGGPYKGCFHVPRALWLCWRLLGDWPAAGRGRTHR